MPARRKVLKAYSESSLKLAALLKSDVDLQIEDQVLIQNHLLIMQLALTAWKHRHGKKQRQSESPDR